MKKKRIGFTICSIMIFVIQLLSISTIYSIYDHWKWLGYPTVSKMIYYMADIYPGHSINCIKYHDFADEWQDEHEIYVYENIGEGINIAGFDIHIGDTKSQVHHQLRYGNWMDNEHT